MDTRFLLHSRTDAPRLRVGLLMNGVVTPSWVAEIISQLLRCDFVTVSLVVFNAERSEPAPEGTAWPALSKRVLGVLLDPDRRRRLLYALYQRWDARNVDAAIDPLTSVDCTDRLEGVRKLSVMPVTRRFVHRLMDADVQTIRDEKLDVLVRFGFNILRGDVLKAAHFGVWSFHHGDNEFYRGGPAYFWELVEENPFSGVILQVLSEKLDAGLILYKGNYATELGTSQARNRVRPYWGASTFLIQKLRELHQDGWEALSSRIQSSPYYRGRHEIYRAPTNGDMLAWLTLRAYRSIRRRLRPKWQTFHWRLGIRAGGKPLPESGAAPDLSGFQWVDSPRGHYYADPFIAQEGERRWVFFEDYDYAARIGTIRYAELHGTRLGDGAEALRRPYHLSYPCVFRDSGRWYMIPESAQSGKVELYVAQDFPGDWQLERVLIDAPAVDSTIWIENGIYWLFVTRVELRGHASQLWLYSSDSLSGDWRPHRANPISSDVRYARGAGAIFRYGGRLFRPSQDGTIRYGRRIVLNEILELDPDSYRECVAVEVEPEDVGELLGIHSYAIAGDLEVIDGLSAMRSREVQGEPRGS